MKQPKALKILLWTEMFERFGLYTIEAMLILYLINHLSFTDKQSYIILGEFTTLAYITPLIGGWISDIFLGDRFSILIGGFFECLGYALLSLSTKTLYLGLSFAIIGAALLKPNISSFLGRFYEEKENRREAGFTLFYVGCCIGITLSMFTSGYIQLFLGWTACFGAASFALLLSISIFRLGYVCFENKGFPPTMADSSLKSLWVLLKNKPKIIGCLLLLFSLVSIFFVCPSIVNYALIFIGLIFYGYVICIASQLDTISCKQTLTLLLLFIVSACFWALLFQMFFAINVFTDRILDRNIFGIKIPAAVFLGLETLFVSLIGPLLAKIWQKKVSSISAKFALALLMMGLSMQLLVWIAPDAASSPSAAWLVLFYGIMAIGDLLLSPTGLSAVSQYAPPHYKGLMMGGWFMSMGFGGKLAGILAELASVPKGVTNLSELNKIYHHAFQEYAWLGFIVSAITFALIPIIQKLLHEKK